MGGNEAPLGVFDSGIGGLTVVRELLSALPGEGIVYLGDTARVPYGIRSPETVRRYASEGAAFLLEKRVKLLVVACNTMSAVGLDGMAGGSTVPVVEVILPGAAAAARATKNKKVGVIGTEATVKSGTYARAILSMDSSIEVISVPCPLFVPLVEEGWLEGDVPMLVAAKYLGGLRERGIDTLVLGCTHYPLLKPAIAKIMGPDVILIDSAQETARQVREELGNACIVRKGTEEPQREFFVTDDPEKFRVVGGRFLGTGIGEIRKVRLEVGA